jgi:hypothetical protein
MCERISNIVVKNLVVSTISSAAPLQKRIGSPPVSFSGELPSSLGHFAFNLLVHVLYQVWGS